MDGKHEYQVESSDMWFRAHHFPAESLDLYYDVDQNGRLRVGDEFVDVPDDVALLKPDYMRTREYILLDGNWIERDNVTDEQFVQFVQQNRQDRRRAQEEVDKALAAKTTSLLFEQKDGRVIGIEPDTFYVHFGFDKNGPSEWIVELDDDVKKADLEKIKRYNNSTLKWTHPALYIVAYLE